MIPTYLGLEIGCSLEKSKCFVILPEMLNKWIEEKKSATVNQISKACCLTLSLCAISRQYIAAITWLPCL